MINCSYNLRGTSKEINDSKESSYLNSSSSDSEEEENN
jgi:hypothetical protein